MLETIPQVFVEGGAARRLANFVDLSKAWILLYPQAAHSALGNDLRRQCTALQASAKPCAIARIEPAPEGLLTLGKARLAAQRFWSACHAFRASAASWSARHAFRASAASWSACHASRASESIGPATGTNDSGLSLVAIGGGSVMDLAKVMRWLPSPERATALAGLSDEAWLKDLQSGLEQDERLRLLLLPTTAGTGSEATPYATLWGQHKHSFHHPRAFADLAIIDEELTYGMPWTLTRDSGLDALSHALDVLWNRASDAALRARATEVARQIVDALWQLRPDPETSKTENPPARRAMAEAAMHAGQLIARTESSLVHALSYPLTLHENLSHGLACAQWIAAVAAIAANASPELGEALDTIWVGSTAGEHDAVALIQTNGKGPLTTLDDQELRIARIAGWLASLGVMSRRIDDEAGKAALAVALEHPRGRNFVGVVNRVSLPQLPEFVWNIAQSEGDPAVD